MILSEKSPKKLLKSFPEVINENRHLSVCTKYHCQAGLNDRNVLLTDLETSALKIKTLFYYCEKTKARRNYLLAGLLTVSEV